MHRVHLRVLIRDERRSESRNREEISKKDRTCDENLEKSYAVVTDSGRFSVDRKRRVFN